MDWYASPLAMYPPIKFIEYDVRKQWAENAALRRTLLRNSSLSVFLDRCFQHSAYDAQQTFVAYSQTPVLFLQLSMFDMVIVSFDIHIHHIMISVYLCQFIAHSNCLLTASVRAKSIAIPVKLRLTDWF